MNPPPSPQAADSTPPLRLAGHTLDLDAGTLRDACGALVAMRPQAWAVLALLARHAGEVVTKEQMLDAVWPGLVVTESSLTQAVKDARAALGPHGRDAIKTVARRGYLLAPDALPRDDGYERDATPSALPVATRLFGRNAELDELRQLLAQHRLVTVLGTGGIGKTAFALAAAHGWVEREEGSAAWVDLAPISDPALIPATLAHALGVAVSQGDDPLRGLLAAVRPLRGLIVIDNAEHIVDGVARIVRAVLDAAPDLHLLVTSQAALHLDGERSFRLAPLALPRPGEALAEASRAAAVALFADRARAADRRFELTGENLATVVRLCRRLDGLPLAIRLAAGRVHLLGLSSLESHLDDSLQWLASPSRDAPARQQTLLAALEWSYGLLAAPEQRLFRRLGVFVGGFTIALALAVGRRTTDRQPAGHNADDIAVLATLEGLVERSLVTIDPGEPPRYRLLESQREHALRELVRTGELADVQRWHAQAMADAWTSAGEALWNSIPDARWLAAWAPELDNTRTALGWSERNDPALFASLIGSAHALFRLLDFSAELRRRIAAVDASSIAQADAGVVLRYWLARSYLEGGVSSRTVHDCAAEAERVARAGGDRRGLYIALSQRGVSGIVTGDVAHALLAEIVALELPDWPPRVRCEHWLAEFAVHALRPHWPEALRAAEAGFALALEGGSTGLTAVFGNWIVVALLGCGDVNGAIERSRAIRVHIMKGPAGVVAPFIGTCARLSLRKGDYATTRQQLTSMFDLCRTIEWAYFEVYGDLYLGLALAEGRVPDAARLLGYSIVASERAWGVLRTTRSRDDAQAALAQRLEPALLERLIAEGTAMDPEAVCKVTLARPAT